MKLFKAMNDQTMKKKKKRAFQRLIESNRFDLLSFQDSFMNAQVLVG